jgi:transposase
MKIVVALDVHRSQITFKALDRETGELRRGRIAPATRAELRAWLSQFADWEAEFAVEGTTGWRFVVEEIERAGQRAHLADPAETAARRGRKRRAKTDNADCDLQLRLLLADELPESWIPPAQILELRTLVRLRKTLIDQRTAWQLAPLDRELRAFARRQPGCRALIEQLYGVGPVSATAILAELGDCRRFSSSDDAVRHAGLDVTVYQSDEKRAPGHLSHEGAGGIALGALRGGRLGRPRQLARPQLLPASRRAARPQPRLPVGRAQALPARLPHPARARRAGPPRHVSRKCLAIGWLCAALIREAWSPRLECAPMRRTRQSGSRRRRRPGGRLGARAEEVAVDAEEPVVPETDRGAPPALDLSRGQVVATRDE